jgi:hypothetical protein
MRTVSRARDANSLYPLSPSLSLYLSLALSLSLSLYIYTYVIYLSVFHARVPPTYFLPSDKGAWIPTAAHWSYGVTVSTLDSESSDRGSNPRRTSLLLLGMTQTLTATGGTPITMPSRTLAWVV